MQQMTELMLPAFRRLVTLVLLKALTWLTK
jgi:hypothetical protein